MPRCRHGGVPHTTLVASWTARSAHLGIAPGIAPGDPPGAARDAGTGAAGPLDVPRARGPRTPDSDLAAAEVVDALRQPRPDPGHLADALVRFAWQRAGDGTDLDCAVAEVDALWDLLEPVGSPALSRASARHFVIDAWVDAMAAERDTPAIDPLSGLHTIGYLAGRVHELDRLSPYEPTALVLLAVRWQEPEGPWLRISRLLTVAAAMRDHVRAEATLAQMGASVALALLPDDARSRLERGALSRALSRPWGPGSAPEPGPESGAAYRVDLMPVPEDRTRLAELIGRLRDESGTRSKEAPHTP